MYTELREIKLEFRVWKKLKLIFQIFMEEFYLQIIGWQ